MEFTISNRCSRCNGKGTVIHIISTNEVIAIVEDFAYIEDEVRTIAKIPAIKELRNRYSELTLTEAKELIEGAIELFKIIDKNATIKE